MSIKVALVISIVLHSLLFFKLSSVEPDKPKPPQKAKGKERPVKISFLPMSKTATKPCKEFYVGLGVSYSPITDEISEIAPNSPASHNDIRVGDLLTDLESYRNLPIGSKVQVTILRRGIIITKDVIINKICTLEKE